MSVLDCLLEPRLQLIVVPDDLLRMGGFNRRDQYDDVPGILDIDHQFLSPLRSDLTHSAERLTAVDKKHWIADFNRFLPATVL